MTVQSSESCNRGAPHGGDSTCAGEIIRYLLKTGSPLHLRALRAFEPLMVVTGIVTPFAAISVNYEVVFYSFRARVRFITEHMGYLCLRKPLVGRVRVAQPKSTDIRGKRNIACNESTNGKWHPDACWMDLLTSSEYVRSPTLSAQNRMGRPNAFRLSQNGGHLSASVVWIGFSLITILCLTLGWGQTSSTETEIWPEVDAHVQLPSHLRVLAFGGLEQGIDYPFQQWYSAAALGSQFKPILMKHLLNIDPDKEHYLVFGGGYEFLRTAQSGEVHHENRITIDATPGFRPSARFLLRDRNWVELRWIDRKYSTTYRNQLSVERDFLVHEVRFTPYGSAEIFYDGPKHSWDQEWYTAGVQLPSKRLFMLETYYRREHCKTCTPTNWNAAGVTLNFYFANPK